MNLDFLVILNTDRVTWGERNLPDNLILLWWLKRARGRKGRKGGVVELGAGGWDEVSQ